MKLTGENRSTWAKICRSATLSTTNPTWADPGSNLGLRCDRLATNSLSHGTAQLLNTYKITCRSDTLTMTGEVIQICPGVKEFSHLQTVRIGFEAHSAFYSGSTGGSFLGSRGARPRS